MTEISITRALMELKTLDKRIQQAIQGAVFVSITGQLQKPSNESLAAVSKYQSITDLLERRAVLKSKIVKSNANTNVKICGKEMSIAEAIEKKSTISHFKNLLTAMRKQYLDANTQVTNMNNRIRNDLDNKISTGMQNTNTESKFDIADFSKKYIEINGISMYDPLKLASKIEELDSYITSFESEVDYVLSEKNSTTTVTL